MKATSEGKVGGGLGEELLICQEIYSVFYKYMGCHSVYLSLDVVITAREWLVLHW